MTASTKQPVISVKTRIKDYQIGPKKLIVDLFPLTSTQVTKITNLINDKEEVVVSISLVQLKLDLKDNPDDKGGRD